MVTQIWKVVGERKEEVDRGGFFLRISKFGKVLGKERSLAEVSLERESTCLYSTCTELALEHGRSQAQISDLRPEC